MHTMLTHHLLIKLSLALCGFFVEKRFDAYTTCLRAEMATKGIGASESSAAPPRARVCEVTFANEFFLA